MSHYLRIVLLHTQSYADLLKVSDVHWGSFREACYLLGLLKDDTQWHNEAASVQMPYQFWRMSAMILTYCHPSCPLQLWEDHKSDLLDYDIPLPDEHVIHYRNMTFIKQRCQVKC